MTLCSVAMIVAPNLFLVSTSPLVGSTSARRAPKRLKELLEEVSTAAGISSVICLVIYYQDLLWQVKQSVSCAAFRTVHFCTVLDVSKTVVTCKIKH